MEALTPLQNPFSQRSLWFYGPWQSTSLKTQLTVNNLSSQRPIHNGTSFLTISLFSVSIDLAVAIELIQVRTGPAVGRPTFRGITPVDSPDALMAEFTETWKRLRGTDGVQMLMNIRALNKAIKESRRNGMSYKALLSLGNWEETLAC